MTTDENTAVRGSNVTVKRIVASVEAEHIDRAATFNSDVPGLRLVMVHSWYK